MNINDIAQAAYENSRAHGFHEQPTTVGDRLMLIVSEIAEALEEYRNNHRPNEIYFNPEKPDKPEGVPVELADAVIRIAEFSALYGINLGAAIEQKMAYNRTRPYRHGGKRL